MYALKNVCYRILGQIFKFFMRKKILSLLFFLASCSLYAQNWVELGYIGSCKALALDASGSLYAGGFRNANGYYYVAKWNGTRWRELGLGTSTLNANAAINTLAFDSDDNLYVAGSFTNAPYATGKQYVAKWNGTTWSELSGYAMNALAGTINNIDVVATDAAGNVYAAAGLSPVNSNFGVFKWNGIEWTHIGMNVPYVNNFQGTISAMVIDKAGNVYVSGWFTKAHETYYVAKWNGTSWSEVGTGSNALNANGAIYALALDADDNLLAGGFFKNSNDQYYIAKWNGSTWSQVGIGANALNVNTGIITITTDLSGNIYAGGNFHDPTTLVGYIVKWDGTTWSHMGPDYVPTRPLPQSQVNSIITDKVTGDIYAAGQGFLVSEQAYGYVVKWNSGAVATSVTAANVIAVAVYPNPSAGIISLPEFSENIQVTVLDALGKTLSTKEIIQGTASFDYSYLSAGMYTLVFTGTDFSYAPVKFIKE